MRYKTSKRVSEFFCQGLSWYPTRQPHIWEQRVEPWAAQGEAAMFSSTALGYFDVVDVSGFGLAPHIE